MEKKRVIKNMENLTDDVFGILKKTYPDGWSNHIIKVNRGNNQFFHAITLDTHDTTYLIKVNVRIDKITDESEPVESDQEDDYSESSEADNTDDD